MIRKNQDPYFRFPAFNPAKKVKPDPGFVMNDEKMASQRRRKFKNQPSGHKNKGPRNAAKPPVIAERL
ncbi:MAG TPA: hypothetical protein PKW98_09350, partial [Candidatus Wallbacteria bacterium]|nr:hypothetical protein [Candidatus Wallbacteria bacterium]